MSTAQTPEGTTTLRLAQASDLRRHQRVPVALLGRYMLSDRREYPCQTVDMSPGGVRLTCAVVGTIGERVVLYLEHIGRIEGVIARHPTGGFAVQLAATPRKRDKIASQLTWLANREIKARVIDISMSGVALASVSTPPIGTSLTIGRTPGKLVRYFEGGFGVQFMLPLSPDRFHDGMTL